MILILLAYIVAIVHGFQFIHPTENEGPFPVGSNLNVEFDIGGAPLVYVSIDYQNEIIYPGTQCELKGNKIYCKVTVKPPIMNSMGIIRARESLAKPFTATATFKVIYIGNSIENNNQSSLVIEEINIFNIWEPTNKFYLAYDIYQRQDV